MDNLVMSRKIYQRSLGNGPKSHHIDSIFGEAEKVFSL
jgi:hypothetical protein